MSIKTWREVPRKSCLYCFGTGTVKMGDGTAVDCDCVIHVPKTDSELLAMICNLLADILEAVGRRER